jgi:hypothetical protein
MSHVLSPSQATAMGLSAKFNGLIVIAFDRWLIAGSVFSQALIIEIENNKTKKKVQPLALLKTITNNSLSAIVIFFF